MISHPDASYILDTLSTAVLIFNKKLYLQHINSAAEILLKVSNKQVHGLHAEEIFPGSKCFQRLKNIHHSLTEHGIRIAAADGELLTVDCCLTPLQNSRNFRYVVELTRIDNQLRLNKEENLLQHHQTAHNIVRGLAHEIKNPLGGLRGAAQLLARQLGDPELQEYTDIIIGEADRLQTLLDRMLGPRTLPHKEMLNIHRTLCRVSQLIQSEAPSSLRVQNDFDPSLPELSADPDQIHQAILNIMRNAMQAMDGQGLIILRTRIERKLTLGHRQHRLVVRVDIQDNGPGVPEALQEQIFYPLVTGRPDGTGLGLSIAQTLINQHGGLIVCRSEPGNTVFSLLLPVENGEYV